MSTSLKRGRKSNKGFKTKHSGINFEIRKFRDVLSETTHLFPNVPIARWSIKREWMEFSKKYFSTLRPKESFVRGSYDFFRANNKLLSDDVNQGRKDDASCRLEHENSSERSKGDIYISLQDEEIDITEVSLGIPSAISYLPDSESVPFNLSPKEQTSSHESITEILEIDGTRHDDSAVSFSPFPENQRKFSSYQKKPVDGLPTGTMKTDSVSPISDILPSLPLKTTNDPAIEVIEMAETEQADPVAPLPFFAPSSDKTLKKSTLNDEGGL